MKSLTPYDLTKISIVEHAQSVRVNDIVHEANKIAKKAFVEAQISTLGSELKITTTRTKFNGNRYWFLCPKCNQRCGILYLNDELACRKCSKLRYLSQL